MFETIINLLYPNVCGFCGKICRESLCKKCELKLKKYEILSVRNDAVVVFRNRDNNFDYFISILKYEDIVREKIIKYKFGEEAYLYKTFAKIILKNKKVYGFLKSYDIIIPVPLHKRKKQKRGYNQTELVARELIKDNVNLKLGTDILIKTKNTKVQSMLEKEQRRINIRNVFEIKNTEKVKGKKIILFDDIYTTGATSDECSRILRQAGAKEILILTIAKD